MISLAMCFWPDLLIDPAMSDPSVAGLKSSQEVADSFHNMHIAIELLSTSCLAGQYCSILGLQLGKNIDYFFP